MQQKKNIRLLISLVIMIALIIGIFFFTNSINNPSVDKGVFQIAALEKVDRVVLESPAGKTDLKFDGVKWSVDGYEADGQMIDVLFAALKQVEAKRKIASSLRDSVSSEINKNGVKISCFVGQSMVKEFWSKGNENSETYFQLNDGIPYLVSIPGYRVYVASIFEVPSVDWRDKRVFNFNWQNIKSVEVNFPNDTKQNFKASFQNKLFSIEGLAATDTTKLDAFMDGLFQLRADKILLPDQTRALDSLLSQKPLETISIQDIANRTYELSLFPIKKGKTGVIARRNKDVIELNPVIIRGIVKKKEYFLAKKD